MPLHTLLVAVGSAGDVHPFVGLGIALRGRGHDVTVLTNEHFEPLVRRAGLGFAPLGTEKEYQRTIADPDLWEGRRAFFKVAEGIIALLPRAYEEIARRYQPGRTVVAASSMGVGARVAQERLGVPTATVHLSPALFRSASVPPVLPGVIMPAWLPASGKHFLFWLGDVLVIDRVLAGPINAFRAGLGLPPVRRVMDSWWNAPERVLGLFPDWFGPPQPDWPPQTRLTGFPLYDEQGVSEAPPELDDFLAAGEPPVVFTAGSAMRHGHAFYEASAEACRLLGRRGLLLTRFPDQLPAHLPPGVRHFAYVPFSRLLPRAAALVHHGGIGTTAQALAAGVPQLVMPLAHDQFDNAARVGRLGVGSALGRKAYTGPAAARRLVSLLDSPGVAARCREIATRVDKAGAVEAACRALEELARGRGECREAFPARREDASAGS